jgi:hypothetical protein
MYAFPTCAFSTFFFYKRRPSDGPPAVLDAQTDRRRQRDAAIGLVSASRE